MYRNILFCFLTLVSSSVYSGEWTSSISGEWLVFAEDAAYPGQHNSYLSAAIETEYYEEFNNGNDFIIFKPFYRIDQHDDERTHGDIRELSWTHVGENWELLTGISKVFWGATESIHLVDIINQSDLVENSDGEDKLGQPMVKLTLIKDWGVLDIFALPGFRERTYPSVNGRPRTGVFIDANRVLYDDSNPSTAFTSSNPQSLDYAIRWSDTLGDWDIGVSYFNGVSREPVIGGFIASPPSLGVFYEPIQQFGVDAQAILGDWLLKIEAIKRIAENSVISTNFFAFATGVEVTLVGVYESQIDVGIIAEYLYDERSASPFQNDLVLGSRIAFNDAEGSEILVSGIFDLEGDGQAFNLEASSRIGEEMKLSIEARGVANPRAGSVLANFEKDNRVRAELTYYF